jgi:hypothetical protein
MNRKIFGVFIAVLAVVILALPMSAVFAKNDTNGKFIPVEGSASYALQGSGTKIVVPNPYPGPNAIWAKIGCASVWTGDIEADDATCDFRTIFFNFVPPLSSEGLVTHLTWTLKDPTIAGEPYEGELVISVGSGGWRIISGTGELANIHGQGTGEGAGPGGIEYEGYVHFGP